MPQLMLPADLMEYTRDFMAPDFCDHCFHKFVNEMPWQQQHMIIYEKERLAPRLSVWIGDRVVRPDDKRSPLPWTDELLSIKEKVEAYTSVTFNGVLLNYYRDRNDSVAWHSDKDTIPGLKTEIASVSIGQERNFDFRNKLNHKQQYSIKLEHGSLLLMKGDLQKYWEHRIDKSKVPMKGRVNLTFRKVIR